MSKSKPRQTAAAGDPVERGSTEWLVTPADDQTPVISVVMPTLNEEDGIGECIDRAVEAFETLEVPGEIVISDSSTDRTPEIARDRGARVVEPDQPGYGYAYRYAFDRVRGAYIVMGDADTTYDFSELPRLLECVREDDADICMGSRLDGEIKDGAMPALHEYVGNPLLTAFLNAFYDAGVSDAHSGFRVFHRDVLDELELRTDGMEFASEMIMEAGARDLDICETPIVYHEREGEATLESFRDGWRHVRFMLVHAPGYLFSIPGFGIGLLGVVAMGLALTGRTIAGQTFGLHAMIAGSFLTITGYQVGSFGAFARVAGDPIAQPSDPVTDWLLEHFQLERAATVGCLLVVAGGLYGGVLVFQWVAGGRSPFPLNPAAVIALTLVVLGIQTVFSAFFMSVVATHHRDG